MKLFTALAALTLIAAPAQAAPMFAQAVGRETWAHAKAGLDIHSASAKGAALLSKEGPVQQDLINHMTDQYLPMRDSTVLRLVEEQIMQQCGSFLVSRELSK